MEPGSEAEPQFAAAADDLLARGQRPPALRLVTLLRWVAVHRDVLFHGSARGDLEMLEPIRLTRDASPFGDQQAVFAASDPIWALYFATLRREGKFRSTRNGSVGVPDALYPRWYWFSHNQEAETEGRFGDGWLYLLPRDGFRREPTRWNFFDTGQWASPRPVRPLVRIPVTAVDFPFLDRVFPHRREEAIPTTIVRAGARGRRRSPRVRLEAPPARAPSGRRCRARP